MCSIIGSGPVAEKSIGVQAVSSESILEVLVSDLELCFALNNSRIGEVELQFASRNLKPVATAENLSWTKRRLRFWRGCSRSYV